MFLQNFIHDTKTTVMEKLKLLCVPIHALQNVSVIVSYLSTFIKNKFLKFYDYISEKLTQRCDIANLRTLRLKEAKFCPTLKGEAITRRSFLPV